MNRKTVLLVAGALVGVGCASAPQESSTSEPEPSSGVEPSRERGAETQTSNTTSPLAEGGDTSASGKRLESAPGAGPGPSCPELPARDCTGTEAYCGELVAFEPVTGPGYDNYPLNGETSTNQYRSYARRDMLMLIRWATAYVHCKAASWAGGNGMPLGLGDMSEKDGAIPGSSIGQPGHPKGTHVAGRDMDIAYYQKTSPNNYLRPICKHVLNGADQYHCVEDPDRMDVWRTALVLGAIFTSERTRVIGVDGRAAGSIQDAMSSLCESGWLPPASCTAAQSKLAYETTDTQRGWYRFHHHHFHVSLKPVKSTSGLERPSGPPSLWPELAARPSAEPTTFDDLVRVPGHAHVE